MSVATVIVPSLAEASSYLKSTTLQTNLRDIIRRSIHQHTIDRGEADAATKDVVVVVLDHLELFGTRESNDQAGDDSESTQSVSCPHAVLISDIYSLLRAAPPLLSSAELEALAIHRLVFVGCFSGPPEDVHGLLSSSFDLTVHLTTPSERERQKFYTDALQSFQSNLAPSDAAFFAECLAQRSGGITYGGLRDVAATLPRHLHAWTSSLLGPTSWLQDGSSLAHRVIQEFQRSSSSAAALLRTNVGYVDIQSTRWSDIAGLEDAKRELQQLVVRPREHKEAYEWCGLRPSTGVVLYGPPGTGKTMLAKAMATELSASFVYVDLPSLVRAEVGESEKRLSSFFYVARDRSPSVIFIDELQAAFGMRYDGSSAHESRLVSHLLQCIDEAHEDPTHLVIVVGATNVLNHLDPLLLRAGRLDTTIHVSLPSETARRYQVECLVKKEWAAWFSLTASTHSLPLDEAATYLISLRDALALLNGPHDVLTSPSKEVCLIYVDRLLRAAQQALVDFFVMESDGLSGAEIRNAATMFAIHYFQRSSFSADVNAAVACLPAVVLTTMLKPFQNEEESQTPIVTLTDEIAALFRESVRMLRESHQRGVSFYG